MVSGGLDVDKDSIAVTLCNHEGCLRCCVCPTLQLSKAIAFETLLIVPRYFVFVTLAAWLAAFMGLFWISIARKTFVGVTARK